MKANKDISNTGGMRKKDKQKERESESESERERERESRRLTKCEKWES